ncbi:MAG: hypothetical protein ACRD28_04685, partial [Acidobacteriaceae bacterium]
ATGKPILLLSRLAILASIVAKRALGESANLSVHVVLDAGRGEFYHGIYRDAGENRIAESFATLDALAESIGEQPGEVVFSEPAVKIALASVAGAMLREISPPAVQDALPLALAAWNAGEFHDPADVDANYLRRSDAVVVSRTKADPASQPAQSRYPRQ